MGEITNFPYGVASFGAPSAPYNLFGFNSACYFVDPVNGSDGADGTSPSTAVQTLQAGYDLLIPGQNQILFVLGTASLELTETFVWAKDLTHLIGVCAPVHENQRARLVWSTAQLNGQGLQITATGCSFRNLYLFYGTGFNTDLVAVEVDGSRNYFENVHVAGPGSATQAGTAAYTSLLLKGCTECTFNHCTIGLTTEPCSTTTNQISFAADAGRILFEDCNIINMSSAATPVLVYNTAVNGIVDYVLFKRCQFMNFSVNWATPLTQAIENASGNSGAIICQACMFTGCTIVGGAGYTARTFVLGGSSTGAGATDSLAQNP